MVVTSSIMQMRPVPSHSESGQFPFNETWFFGGFKGEGTTVELILRYEDWGVNEVSSRRVKGEDSRFPGSPRLPCAEVDTQSTEGGRPGLLRCTRKYVITPGDLKMPKAGLDYRCLKLCFQQSTGDSTGPQIYLHFR